MVYPNLTAGHRLTAADLAALQPAYVFKAASTDRASTTVLTDDPDLQFTLAANAVYVIEFYLFYAGGPGKFQTAWTIPTGASGNRSVMGPGSAATDTSADNISMRSGVHGYATVIAYGARTTSSTNQLIAVETSLLTTSAAGLCAIKWSQVTSNAGATRMGAGSWARAKRIA